jgi:hypothetical protein
MTRSVSRISSIGKAALAVGLLAGSTSSSALERSERQWTGEGREWNAGSTCAVSYYNLCTGWYWVWSDFYDEDQIGVQFDTCCPNATLESTWIFAEESTPTYAFTGYIDVYEADSEQCPTGPPIASNFFLPRTGWNEYVWNVPVHGQFVVMARLQNGAGDYMIPMWLVTDHPAAGPTGPAACGTCYPATRETHSFQYGTETSPWCPGLPFQDGTCAAELVWYSSLTCAVHTTESSWGSLKALYR